MDIISYVIGIIGILIGAFSAIRTCKVEKRMKTLYWEDLKNAASDLSESIKKDFYPDIIFTPGIKGGIVAYLLSKHFDRDIPAFVGVLIWKKNKILNIDLKDHHKFSTNKWYIYMPNVIFSYKEAKILIVDDFAMSGDFIYKVKELLISRGFNEENIKISCITTTKVAISNYKAPDYYWKITDSDDFYFPWGKAR